MDLESIAHLVPVLTTERLRLRPPRDGDLRHLGEVWSLRDDEPLDAADVDEEARAPCQLAAQLGHWLIFGYGSWVIETTEGVVVGAVGFGIGVRAVLPPLRGPEMGWVLHPARRGRGYALEACRAALDWIDHARQPKIISALCEVDNSPSRALAQKLRFQKVRETDYLGRRCVVLERR